MHVSNLIRSLCQWTAIVVPAVGVGVWDSSSMASHDTSCTTAVTLTEKVGTLEFGSIAGDDTSPGTVVVTPAGAKSVTGGVFDLGGAAAAAASWEIGGDKQCTVILILPSSITVTTTGGSTTVDTFTSDLPTNPSTITIPNSKRITFTVGGTLNIGAGQTAGTYTGNIPVTVNYD